MSENDTFNVLKRIPYSSFIKLFIEWRHDSADERLFHELCAEYGYSPEEVFKRMEDKNA